ncbi:MAG: hypothetical protein M1812_006391 [Candelaria pacifica]|nr:MAG: hypothetical protein M1812_006391 [Candelaria pacifica]
MSEPVVLIFGAGANVGLAIATKFKQEGYKVAAVSRTIKDDLKKVTHKTIASSLTPEEVQKAFEEVEKELGPPNVVVYNAYSLSVADGADPLSLSLSDFLKDLNVNTSSAYAAASTAVTTFTKVSSTLPKVFIYTGNMCSSLVIPEVFSMGVGKNAMAYVIQTAAETYGIKGKGEKGFWYFADQRFNDGASVMAHINGEAHGDYYWQLVNQKTQGPWNNTFVKGKGYKKFEPELKRDVAGMMQLIQQAEERKGEL